jgi:hypothetical protein
MTLRDFMLVAGLSEGPCRLRIARLHRRRKHQKEQQGPANHPRPAIEMDVSFHGRYFRYLRTEIIVRKDAEEVSPASPPGALLIKRT